jgi:pterin-4a-carbinolamine dehydratase
VPFATVITPTCRRPALLGRMLRSLQAQDLGDWEAVVVDDGGGEGIAAAEAFGDPRIVARSSRGSGIVDARNTALALASGELVCWLDDDDWWDDRGHLSLLREAAAGPGRRFFFRGGWLVHEGGAREPFDLDATAQSLRVNNTIVNCSLAYPRALHDELGELDPETGGYCDWDFMLRMCDAGLVPHRLPGLGVCYAIHAGSQSSAVDAPMRRASFEAFKAKHGLDIVISNHLLINRLLGAMPDPEGWVEVDGALEREFRFESFPAAIAFVNRVAELAEAENHHPDIAVSYRTVTLRWRTHSADAITDRDRELAASSAALA